MWKTATPGEFLAITGGGIESVKISKKSWIFPWQRYQKFRIQPQNYSMNLQAMTRDKLQFLLPVVFTVGPDVNQRDGHQGADFVPAQPNQDFNPDDASEALKKYVMLLADNDNHDEYIENIVKGIIEGETRVLVSSMSMEEIFTEREDFKKRIYRNIQSELDQFGLRIYNANVKELKDADKSSYFESQSRKAHEGAVNQSRIDVAEAQKLGTVGEARRRGEQDRDLAKIHAETQVAKTERDSERAKAEATLETRKAAYNRDVNIAQIEATRATEARDEELRKEVEVKRAFTELERLRATDVVKATITREAKQQAADAKNYEEQARANADFYSQQKSTDAAAYKQQANANASFYAEQKAADASFYAEQKAADAAAYKVRVAAEAAFDAAQKQAEAELVRQQKAAAGLSAMAGAYANLSQAFGGPQGLIQYMMIEKGVYTSLAQANAEAVRGMNPKMTIWNTGSQNANGTGEAGGMGGMESIRNMYQMLPPLMTTINEQTGITLPEWQFGKLANGLSEREVSGKEINGLGGH